MRVRAKKHTRGYVAAYDLMERVTKEDPRARNDWAIIGIDQMIENRCEETHHTDCKAGNP